MYTEIRHKVDDHEGMLVNHYEQKGSKCMKLKQIIQTKSKQMILRNVSMIISNIYIQCSAINLKNVYNN